MPKELWITDLSDGSTFSTLVAGITDVQQKEDRNGNRYLDLELTDNRGSIRAKVWGDTLTRHPNILLNKGLVIVCDGAVSSYKGVPQLSLNTYKLLGAGEYELADFMLSSSYSESELEAQLSPYIAEIADPDIKDLVTRAISDYREQYFTVPAATANHHHFKGGLAEHVLEMLACGKELLKFYPDANRDLVYAGVIFHDIGKVKELTLDGFVIEYSPIGKLIGHITIGIELIDQLATEIGVEKGQIFSSKKLSLLKHIILSHHGKREAGSPVEPMTLEAEIVSRLDDLSSQVRLFSKSLLENAPDKDGFSIAKPWPLTQKLYMQTASDLENERLARSVPATAATSAIAQPQAESVKPTTTKAESADPGSHPDQVSMLG
jgi:3'-5' exoribonuclease